MPTYNPQKTIVIIGATGNQGSSVARTFLKLPDWHVRCLTRNKTSPKALALAALGAETIEADLNNPSSLKRAFQGADTIFLNTDFWTPYHAALSTGTTSSSEASKIAYEHELHHGINASLAASQCPTLRRFIYSTLPSIHLISRERYPHALHWESKAYIVTHTHHTHPDLAEKMFLVYVGAYASNAFFRPWLEGSRYVSRLPMKKETKCPIIDPRGLAMGGFVRALVEDEPPGTKLFAYEEMVTFEEAIQTWSRVTGREVEIVEESLQATHEKTGIPLEVLEVPCYLAEHHFMAGVEGWIEPPQLTQKVKTRTYEEYLRSCDEAELVGTGYGETVDQFVK